MENNELQVLNDELIKQRQTKNNNFLVIKDFNSIKQMVEILQKHHDYLLAKINQKRQSNNQKLAHKLNVINVTEILENHFYIIRIDKKNDTIPLIYDVLEGIYSQDFMVYSKYCKIIEPQLKETDCKEILFNVKTSIDLPYGKLTESADYVPVNNGIFNRKTNRLEPFDHKYVFLSKISTNYNDIATHSPIINGWTLDKFIQDLSSKYDPITHTQTLDKDMEQLLWQITERTVNLNIYNDKAFFLFSHNGKSGKGTFQEFLVNLIGEDNRGNLKLNEFAGQFALAGLMGKTLCLGDDNDQFTESCGNFNSIVSHDSVRVEPKNINAFSAYIKLTIVESGNHLPTDVKNFSGLFRRLLIIPFNNDFRNQRENKDIKNNYLKRSDVLEYALWKVLHMHDTKLTIPESVKIKMNEFKEVGNHLESFKADWWQSNIINNNITQVPTSFLYQQYKNYCKSNGYHAYSSKKFTQEFRATIGANWTKRATHLNENNITRLNNLINSNNVDFSIEHMNYNEHYFNNKNFNNKKSYNMFIQK